MAVTTVIPPWDSLLIMIAVMTLPLALLIPPTLFPLTHVIQFWDLDVIKDQVLGPVGAVVPFLINVILGKEIAIMTLTALVIWNVVLIIVGLTFQQALIVALLPRQ